MKAFVFFSFSIFGILLLTGVFTQACTDSTPGVKHIDEILEKCKNDCELMGGKLTGVTTHGHGDSDIKDCVCTLNQK